MAERAGLLAQIIRIKGRMKAILHANLIPPYKGYLFGKREQHWLDSLAGTIGSRKSANGKLVTSHASSRPTDAWWPPEKAKKIATN